MFKKIKDNEVYKKFKELRSNPQTKAVMSLALWFIFFIIIILFARSTSSSSKSNNTANYKKITSYEYVYKNNKSTIFGMKYNEKQIFNILDKKYYFDGENIYLIVDHSLSLENNFDLGYLKITPSMIEDLTKNINYTQNGEARQYLIPLINFINLYQNDTEIDLSLANNYNIIVNMYYKNNDLYMIKVDLSNYYKFYNLEDDGVLTIDLYNKNKLNNFTLEYEKMLGVIK